MNMMLREVPSSEETLSRDLESLQVSKRASQEEGHGTVEHLWRVFKKEQEVIMAEKV